MKEVGKTHGLTVSTATACMDGVDGLYPDAQDPAALDKIRERDLVAKAKAGDVEAFEKLYRSNVGRVYGLCLRMTQDKTQSEDLAQEAFVRAWRKLHSFHGRSAFSTWLHRITVNLVLTHLRSQSRRSQRETTRDPIETHGHVAKGATNPGSKMDLETAIAALPEGARKVFVLYEIEGYPHEEIASMLGIASGTTKAQLHRARRMLREALA